MIHTKPRHNRGSFHFISCTEINMIAITVTKNHANYTIMIRRNIDNTYYCSNVEGLLLEKDFPTKEKAIEWALAVLPQD